MTGLDPGGVALSAAPSSLAPFQCRWCSWGCMASGRVLQQHAVSWPSKKHFFLIPFFFPGCSVSALLQLWTRCSPWVEQREDSDSNANRARLSLSLDVSLTVGWCYQCPGSSKHYLPVVFSFPVFCPSPKGTKQTDTLNPFDHVQVMHSCSLLALSAFSFYPISEPKQADTTFLWCHCSPSGISVHQKLVWSWRPPAAAVIWWWLQIPGMEKKVAGLLSQCWAFNFFLHLHVTLRPPHLLWSCFYLGLG